MKFLKGLGLEGLNIEIQEDAGIVAVGESAGDIFGNMLEIVSSAFDLTMEANEIISTSSIGGSFTAGFEADETDTKEQKDSKLKAIAAKIKAFADKIWKFIKAIYAKMKGMFAKISSKFKKKVSEKEAVIIITGISEGAGAKPAEKADEATSVGTESTEDVSATMKEMQEYVIEALEKSAIAHEIKGLAEKYLKSTTKSSTLAAVREGYAEYIAATKKLIDIMSSPKVLADLRKFASLGKKVDTNPTKSNIDAMFEFAKANTDSIVVGTISITSVLMMERGCVFGEKIIARYEKMSAEQLAKNGVTVEDLTRYKELALLEIKLCGSATKIVSMFDGSK